MPQKLSPEITLAAIAGFEEQKKRIDAQIAELRDMLDGGHSSPAATTETEAPKRKRKKFSAAVRRKMALAQRARYAKLKPSSEPAQTATKKPKRKLSAEGRRNIIAATKRRWELKRAEEAKAEAAAATKPGRKKAAANTAA
jgi:hypothetical protein